MSRTFWIVSYFLQLRRSCPSGLRMAIVFSLSRTVSLETLLHAADSFLKYKYLQDTKGNLNGKQQTSRLCQSTEWKPKTLLLLLLLPLNSLILLLTGAYLFMLLVVILYGRSLSHAVPAYCLLLLPWEKFVPMKKGGVTDTPHQHHYHHIARLILTSKKGFLQWYCSPVSLA